MDWCVGRVFLCFNRLPADGTSVPKYVGADATNYILRLVVYYQVHSLVSTLNIKLNSVYKDT